MSAHSVPEDAAGKKPFGSIKRIALFDRSLQSKSLNHISRSETIAKENCKRNKKTIA